MTHTPDSPPEANLAFVLDTVCAERSRNGKLDFVSRIL